MKVMRCDGCSLAEVGSNGQQNAKETRKNAGSIM